MFEFAGQDSSWFICRTDAALENDLALRGKWFIRQSDIDA
jgi:hypothetical protein